LNVALSVTEMSLVVSVTVTFVYSTVIGGLHGGWKVAVSVSEKSALPFCTGKSPAVETSSLFTAFGWLPPRLMHSAVAVTTMWTWSSSPRPASLPETVRVPSVLVALTVLSTKCGLPAHAGTVKIAVAIARTATIHNRRIVETPLSVDAGGAADRGRQLPTSG